MAYKAHANAPASLYEEDIRGRFDYQLIQHRLLELKALPYPTKNPFA